MNWLRENKEWVFSGVGIFVITILSSIFKLIKVDSTWNWITANKELLLIGLVSFLLAFLLCKLIKLPKLKKISLSDNIEICSGDLFAMDGIKIIPVSRFFYETGVYEASLQYQVINKFKLAKGIEDYQKQMDDELGNEDPEIKTRDETLGEEKYYPLGTTALIENIEDKKQEKYLLLALTKTELKGKIPDVNCDIKSLWTALGRLWASVHKRGIDDTVNVPLLGSGVAGVGLSANRILEINLLALLASLKERPVIPKKIRIVIYHKHFNKLDLRALKREWENEF